MKSYFLSNALFIFALTAIWKLFDGHPCGQAGSFVNTRSQEISYESQFVSYRCTYEGVLFGNRKRFCQTNGTWTGTIPLCILPTGKFVRAVNQSSIDRSQGKDLNASECLNDFFTSNPCIRLELQDRDKSITIHFNRLYTIVAVRLSYSPQDSYNSTEVYLFENSTNLVGSRGILCGKREMDVFKCPRPIPALSMSIRFLSTLNEVYIYEKRTDLQCSSPDVPAFGRYVGKFGGRMTQYICYENYILKGNKRSICLFGGTWSEPAPICQSNDLCEPFVGDFNISGKWVTEQIYDDFWRSTLKCDDGFRVHGGPSTIECLSKRQGWSQTNAICRPSSNTERFVERLETATSNNFSFKDNVPSVHPSNGPHSNYIIIVLGCLLGVLLFITVIIVMRNRRSRNLVTVPYYAWSNGTNEAPHSEQVGSARVPCPLPRNALEIDSRPLRLRPESGEADETRHYSVVDDQGNYLTILEDPKEDTRDDTSAISNLYQECAPKRREADCTTIHHAPDTRFFELVEIGGTDPAINFIAGLSIEPEPQPSCEKQGTCPIRCKFLRARKLDNSNND